ncbi:MAG: hypothetical protein ACLPUO_19575 [Streptosporangiaceae bacterium]
MLSETRTGAAASRGSSRPELASAASASGWPGRFSLRAVEHPGVQVRSHLRPDALDLAQEDVGGRVLVRRR